MSLALEATTLAGVYEDAVPHGARTNTRDRRLLDKFFSFSCTKQRTHRQVLYFFVDDAAARRTLLAFAREAPITRFAGFAVASAGSRSVNSSLGST